MCVSVTPRTTWHGELVRPIDIRLQTLYHESMLCYFESCSKDTLSNAFYTLKSWRIITLKRGPNRVPHYELLAPYQVRGDGCSV